MIESNNVYVEENSCEKCENMEICRWCVDMKNTKEQARKLANDMGVNPIRVRVTCNYFKRKKYSEHEWLTCTKNK